LKLAHGLREKARDVMCLTREHLAERSAIFVSTSKARGQLRDLILVTRSKYRNRGHVRKVYSAEIGVLRKACRNVGKEIQ